MKDKRAMLIEKALRSVYDSLQSHLQYTYKKTSEGKRFHIKCVKDYLELMDTIEKLR